MKDPDNYDAYYIYLEKKINDLYKHSIVDKIISAAFYLGGIMVGMAIGLFLLH